MKSAEAETHPSSLRRELQLAALHLERQAEAGRARIEIAPAAWSELLRRTIDELEKRTSHLQVVAS